MRASLVTAAAIIVGFASAAAQQAVPQTTPQQTSAIAASLEKLRDNHRLGSEDTAIVVSVAQQRLFVVTDTTILHTFPVSTSKFGIGGRYGSRKTPPGSHRIREMIGAGAPPGAIFRERRRTGKTAEILSDSTDTPLDLVTTRIMWLDGLEPGVNRGGRFDSHDRYIYIHGTPEEGLIGTPQSNGCIRMKNADVIAVFDLVAPGTLVEIQFDKS